MNAQGSSRTVLFDVGGVLVDAHPDPHAIAELFGDGSRGLTTLVDQAMWTHRGETLGCPTVNFGTVSPEIAVSPSLPVLC